MTQLLIDIGNSRIKWCVARGARPGRQRVLPLSGTGSAAFARIARAARGATAVIAVCVAGDARERALSRALRTAGLPAAQFIRSSAAAAGLRNGYREAWRLGAAPDRNALVAALLEQGVQGLDAFAHSGFAGFDDDYRDADSLAGRAVTVSGGSSAVPLSGIAQGIDADGALLVQTPAGIDRILSGDVSVRATAT